MELDERRAPSDFLSTLANISAKSLTLIAGSSSIAHTVSLDCAAGFMTGFSCIRFQNSGFIGKAGVTTFFLNKDCFLAAKDKGGGNTIGRAGGGGGGIPGQAEIPSGAGGAGGGGGILGETNIPGRGGGTGGGGTPGQVGIPGEDGGTLRQGNIPKKGGGGGGGGGGAGTLGEADVPERDRTGVGEGGLGTLSTA